MPPAAFFAALSVSVALADLGADSGGAASFPEVQESKQAAKSVDPDLLSDETFETWRDFLLPQEDEVAWCEGIQWLDSFQAGVVAAQREGKPILLWAMNGHPKGCT